MAEGLTIEPDELYRRVMTRIKPRIELVRTLLVGPRPLPLRQAVESAALQLRLVMEEIALSSLVANKEAYATEWTRFHKDWNATLLLSRIERLNPKFYPVPYKGQTTDERGFITLHPRTDGYLTRQDFGRRYGWLSSLCHAPNPYASTVDYNAIVRELIHLRTLIMRLLNAHQVRLIGDSEIWIVHMVTKADPSKVYSVTLRSIGRVDEAPASWEDAGIDPPHPDP